MTTVGPQNPTAAVSNNPAAGRVAWSTPGNVLASDDSRATSALSATQTTQDLDVTGFDFSAVPDTATVDGITVSIERSVSSTTGSPKDFTIQLLLAGVASGANKATATTWPTTDAYATYGSASDKWTLTMTGADLKASGFGVRIKGSRGSGKGFTTMRVDHVRITVDYTAGGGGGGTVGRIVKINQAVRRASTF